MIWASVALLAYVLDANALLNVEVVFLLFDLRQTNSFIGYGKAPNNLGHILTYYERKQAR